MILSVIKDTISLVCLSKCGKNLVCAGSCGTTALWKKIGNRWKYEKLIFKQNSAPTAMVMHSKANRIVLAFANYTVGLFRNFQTVCVQVLDLDLLELLPFRTIVVILCPQFP